MGKKGGWFSAVKKALKPRFKKNQKIKSKKWNVENKTVEEAVPSTEQLSGTDETSFPPPSPPPVVTKPTEISIDEEQNRHAYSIAVATAAVAEAAVAAAQAAAEVVRLTSLPRFVGKSKEEISAIKIQTAFRGYMARKKLRALRGLERLKSLIEGKSVKRQTSTTLRCMQTLARVQSQIQARRIRMSEENLALQRQLNLKHEKELGLMKTEETFDARPQSKEQIEANLQNKQEAARRRERALAYAFTHQKLRKNNKSSNPTFMNPNNPQWGWSWLERWMAARPWETKSLPDIDSNDHGSLKSFRTLSVAGEINRAYALRDLNKPSPSRQSPSTPRSGKPRPGLPKPYGSAQDEDTRSTTTSVQSDQSDQFRRHSVSGSSARDGPSYMVATRSAKARTKTSSPLGATPPSDQKPSSVGPTKNRLSFPPSPSTPRRHSVPGKLENAPVKHVPSRLFL